MIKESIKNTIVNLMGKPISELKVPAGIKVVSFDLFDTLVVREVGKPQNVFSKIEKEYCGNTDIIGYAQRRIQAEKVVRKRVRREITITDIYEELKKDYPLNVNELMEAEIAAEMMTCVPNEEVVRTFNGLLDEGVYVVIVTDMYLPKLFLERILEKCGIIGHKSLYDSSDLGVTKRSGSLFEYVLNDLRLEPNEMMHIGDNPRGDYLVPWSIGIRPFLYKG